MALDRFVYFKGKKKPTQEQIGILLEDYLNGAGVVNSGHLEDQGRYYVTLPGKPSFPFRRLVGPQRDLEEREERWIEVYVASLGEDAPSLDVITRQGDELTNCVAEGIAKMTASYWDGEYQPPT